jgi:hypothetical protein
MKMLVPLKLSLMVNVAIAGVATCELETKPDRKMHAAPCSVPTLPQVCSGFTYQAQLCTGQLLRLPSLRQARSGGALRQQLQQQKKYAGAV